jgi:hypothetical protein
LDEPSNGELGRRLDDLGRMLREVIGRPEYGEFKLALDHRFNQLVEAVADLRRTHDEDIKDLQRRFADAEQERKKTIRDRIYDGLIPTMLIVVSFIGALYIAHIGGGK